MLFRIVAVSLFIFAPALRSFANTVSFDPPVNYPVGTFPQSLAIADLNSDGRPDIVTANSGSNNVSVLLNTGTGSFGAATNFAVGASPQAVAIADVNLDGKRDLVVANGDHVSILLGTGTGSFTPASDVSVELFSALALAVGDLNLDGKPDVAVTTYMNMLGNQWRISVLLGTGDGSFSSGISIDNLGGTINHPKSIVISDFNVDGKPDLAITIDRGVFVLPGDGSGSFSPTWGEFVLWPTSVAAGDLNVDGKPDLAVPDGTLRTSVFFGTGTGDFEPENGVPTGEGPVFVAIADFNIDGKPDLAVTAAETVTRQSGVSILLGTGNNSFAAPIHFPLDPAFGMASADLNIDGKADLAVLNGDNVSILLNSQVVPVEIDIRPWTSNQVNPQEKGTIPVAILGSATFDAGSVKLTTVRFGATGSEAMPRHASLQYANDDKYLDMVIHFSIPTTGIACGMTSASLTGETFSGQKVQGSDSISTVGCKQAGSKSGGLK